MKPIKVLLAIFCMCLVLGPVFLRAEETEPVEVEAEGSYLMGDRDSKQDARQLALFEAKRSALEKAGTMLSSSTRVENFELVKDEIYSRAAGRIQCEVIDEKWESVGQGQTLCVRLRIRARVSPKDLEYEPEPALDDSQVETAAKQIEQEPKKFDPGKSFAVAQALVREGRNRAALKILQAMEKRNPNAARIHMLRAVALQREGRPRLAFESLVRACRLGARRACEEIEKIKNRKVHHRKKTQVGIGDSVPGGRRKPVRRVIPGVVR